MGFSRIKHHFWGTLIYGNPHLQSSNPWETPYYFPFEPLSVSENGAAQACHLQKCHGPWLHHGRSGHAAGLQPAIHHGMQTRCKEIPDVPMTIQWHSILLLIICSIWVFPFVCTVAVFIKMEMLLSLLVFPFVDSRMSWHWWYILISPQPKQNNIKCFLGTCHTYHTQFNDPTPILFSNILYNVVNPTRIFRKITIFSRERLREGFI